VQEKADASKGLKKGHVFLSASSILKIEKEAGQDFPHLPLRKTCEWFCKKLCFYPPSYREIIFCKRLTAERLA
jgi:hypothetical protein